MARSDPGVARDPGLIEELHALVGRRERRILIRTVALAVVLAAAAGALLILSVREVQKSQAEAEEARSRLLGVLRHDLQVTRASFDPDGDHVLTASADGVVRIWDWQKEEVVARRLHGEAVAAAEFGPGGRLVVTVGGTEARIWDVRAARIVAELDHPSAVISAALGPGNLLVTGSADRARVWDLRLTPPRKIAEIPERTPDGLSVPIFDVGFGADAFVVATRGAATIYDVSGGAPRREKELTHAGDVRSAAISPDGTRVLTTSSAGAAVLWPRRSDDSPLVLRRLDAAEMLDGAFSADGELVVVAGADGNAEIYRPAKRPTATE